jgi:hypothetical protein
MNASHIKQIITAGILNPITILSTIIIMKILHIMDLILFLIMRGKA